MVKMSSMDNASTPRPGPASRSLIPQNPSISPRALSLFESRSATPRTPRDGQHTLELFFEQRKATGRSGLHDGSVQDVREVAEGVLELEKWKKTRGGTCAVKTRKSYTREFKLQVLTLLRTGRMHRDGKWVKISKHEVARTIGISRATLRDWEQGAEDILKSQKGSRRVLGAGRRTYWPYMEKELVEKFRQARERGIAITRYWFLRHAKQLFREHYPEEVAVIPGCHRFIYPLKFSATWFTAFRSRYRISWRMKTNIAQVSATDKIASLQCYLRFIRRNSQLRESEVLQDVGRYRLGHIYNMDQTPLPFEFLRGRTYEFKGKKTVWIRALRSSWSKRQATLMLTACADGVLRVKPLLIFRGDPTSASYDTEKLQYDRRVRVIFNSKAYSNEEVTLEWIEKDLLPAIMSTGSEQDPRLVALDVFAGQKTAAVLRTFRSYNMVTAFIPEGCTGLVQPMDTSINKVLKDRISLLLDEEVEKNPEIWENDFSISDRRIVITKVVADAWHWLHTDRQLLIQRAFLYTGLSLQPDGSTDSLLRIKDLPNFSIGDWHLSASQHGGFDCNLNSAGKTCAGELDFSTHDEVLIEEDLFDELSPLQNQGAGEYVFESDFLANTNLARTSNAMALSFLCT